MVTPTLPEQPGRGRGHRRWLIGAAIGAGAGVAAIAAVLFSGHPPQPVAPDLATAHRGVMPAPDLAPAIVVPPEMVALPGGTLHQGRAPYGKAPAADAPVHDVAIRPFAIDKTEVTVAAYQRFVDAGQAAPPWPTTLQDVSPLARLPVINVAQGDAARYCRWRTPGGRLPTESEWEWAARGPEGWLYPWGDEFKAACVNGLRGAAGFLSPPGSHPCGNTPTGLADMSGNAWEWTSSPASVYPGSALRAPGPGLYVVRGGSFYSKDRDELTATARQFVRAPNRFIGFRCAMDLPR